MHVGRKDPNGEKSMVVEEVLEDVTCIDRQGKAFATIAVKKLMTIAATEKNVVRRRGEHGLCTTYQELKDRWTKWDVKGEPNLRKDHFHVAIGYFDINVGWDTQIEQEFMSTYGFEYESEKEEKKSKHNRPKATFILDLIRKQKTQLVKLLFAGSKKTHNLHINRSGNTKGIGKVIKRKRGMHSDNLLRVHGKPGCPANVGKFRMCKRQLSLSLMNV